MTVKDTIFVIGTGRSGTSWLSNIINYRNEYQYIFEPFNTRKIPELNSFRYRQYLSPRDKNQVFLDKIKGILSGRLRNNWIDKFNKNSKADKILVKSIRAHHLLYWIKFNFPDVKIVLLLRYPGAVALSKMKLGWEIHIDELLSQENLVSDFFWPFLSKIKDIKDEYGKHILFWCMENYVPLKQFNTGELHVVFYENLCTSSRGTVENLFSFTGQEFSISELKSMMNPSETSRPDSFVVKGRNPLLQYSNPDIVRNHTKVLKIMEIFGMDEMYRNPLLPMIKGF